MVGFLAFVIIFSGLSIFLFNWSKDLHERQLKIKDEEIIFEQKIAKREKELYRKELKIEVDEKSLKKQFSNLKIKEKKLDDSIRDYKNKLETINASHSLYSKVAQKAQAETKIQELMLTYSKLGVSLKKPNWCDKKYTQKYYQAEGLLDQILTINSKYNISNEYYMFVKRNINDAVWININDGVCEAEKNTVPLIL